MENIAKKEAPKLTIKLSWSLVCILLVITNLVTVFYWKPWSTTSSLTRKISVTGEATIKAVPDEYVLSPYFEFANADRAKATEELSKQSAGITAKLKELGVRDDQIKSNTNGYDRYYSNAVPVDNSANTLQLQYTITVLDKDIAQKVQDYLLTLKPKGQISPQAQFSDTKRKDLENQARDKAVIDANSKADKTAKLLNAKVGKAITVSEGNAGGPITYGISDMSVKSSAASGPVVQPGQNDFSYSVSVEYELK